MGGVEREQSQYGLSSSRPGEVQMLFKSMIWLSFFWLMVSLFFFQAEPLDDSVHLLAPPEQATE